MHLCQHDAKAPHRRGLGAAYLRLVEQLAPFFKLGICLLQLSLFLPQHVLQYKERLADVLLRTQAPACVSTAASLPALPAPELKES
jgi:hypothetical protein